MKILITIPLFWYSLLFSQTDSAINFYLPKLKIEQTEKGETAIYEFDNIVNKFSLSDSFLVADKNKYNYKVNISNLKVISVYDGSSYLQGAGWGALTGYAIGFVLGAFVVEDAHTSQKGGFWGGFFGGAICAVPAAVLGGIIGAFIPRYKEFEITSDSHSRKIFKLRMILEENKIKRKR